MSCCGHIFRTPSAHDFIVNVDGVGMSEEPVVGFGIQFGVTSFVLVEIVHGVDEANAAPFGKVQFAKQVLALWRLLFGGRP